MLARSRFCAGVRECMDACVRMFGVYVREGKGERERERVVCVCVGE